MRANSYQVTLAWLALAGAISTVYAQDQTMEHPREIYAVAVSADGKVIASGGAGSSGGIIKLWDTASRQELATLSGHGGPVQALAFSPDGRVLASGEMYSIVKTWDVVAKKELATLKGHSAPVKGIAYSPDAKTIASAGGQQLILWDANSGAARSSLSGHKFTIVGLAFSGDGKTLASADEGGVMIFWDMNSGKQRGTARAVEKDYKGAIVSVRASCMALTSDGKGIVAGLEDGSVRVWDVDQGGELLRLEKVEANGLAVSPDGSKLAVAAHDGLVKLFNVGSPKDPPDLLKGHLRTVRSVAFTPDGRMLVSGSFDRFVRIWPVAIR
jgi:WD40 repeat protein